MTLAINEREKLRRILDLSDRLGSLRKQLRDGASPPRDFGKEIRAIAGSVVSIGLPGTLGRLASENRLGPQETLILLLLLNRRIEVGESSLTGREILATIFPSSYGILSGTALLRRDAHLLASGAVEAVAMAGVDILESSFSISDGLFRMIELDASPVPGGPEEPGPYENHWEHLADLARLTTLMLQRSNALFDVDPYGTRVPEGPEAANLLERRTNQLTAIIRFRLDRTPEVEDFPIIRLARTRKLSRDEQLVIAVLLAQESFFGSPGLEAVDCVKMLCRTPEEVLRKRSILSPGGRLRAEGLVEIEDSLDDRELTGDLYLPSWVVSELLGEERNTLRPIGPDTRLDFHEYLSGLGDSEQFYRDLDG